MVRREQTFGAKGGDRARSDGMGAAPVLETSEKTASGASWSAAPTRPARLALAAPSSREGRQPQGATAVRRSQRELAAIRADAARRRRAELVATPRPLLFAGTGHVRLVPRIELRGDDLVANHDLAPLAREHPSAAPGRIARPAGPAAVAKVVSSAPSAVPAPRRRPSAATFRRRRLAAAGAFVLGVLLAGSWALGALGGGSLTASEDRSPHRPGVVLDQAVRVSQATYVVQPGDTLWSIARQVRPASSSDDIRPLVDAIAAERHGRPLQVGETIVVPDGNLGGH
jgi:nucleoid-associated protein YgaU